MGPLCCKQPQRDQRTEQPRLRTCAWLGHWRRAPPVQRTHASKRTVSEPVGIWSASHIHRLGRKILTPLALETPHLPGIDGAINHQMESLGTLGTWADSTPWQN